MSSASQKRFLEKLQAELSGSPTSEYRKETADFRAHVFVMTRRAMNRGIKDALEFEFQDISQAQVKKIQSKVSKAVGDAIENTREDIKKTIASDNSVYFKDTQRPRYRLKAVFEAKGTSRYAKIYSRYKDHLEEVTVHLNVAVKEVLETEKDFKKKELWNLEHNKFEGVLESMVKDSIENALKGEELIELADVEKFFKSRGISLRVYRNTKTETMNVFLGSFRANIEEGQQSKARKKKLQKELEKAIAKLEKDPTFSFATLPGSDSMTDIKVKESVQVIIETPFKKVKGSNISTTLKLQDTKISHNTKTTELTKKGKTTTQERMQKKALRRRKLFKGNSASSMPLKLMVMLNRELPRKVAENMKSPALNYRTGRFASSVRVTDVIRTPQGFPSIGYTYQKFPYQTFEPGYAQGDPDRDPRKLINQSIREIAAQYAIGRFYTRRV